MSSVKLYKVLTHYVGLINALAVKLSEDLITKESAINIAKARASELIEILNENE